MFFRYLLCGEEVSSDAYGAASASTASCASGAAAAGGSAPSNSEITPSAATRAIQVKELLYPVGYQATSRSCIILIFVQVARLAEIRRAERHVL